METQLFQSFSSQRSAVGSLVPAAPMDAKRSPISSTTSLGRPASCAAPTCSAVATTSPVSNFASDNDPACVADAVGYRSVPVAACANRNNIFGPGVPVLLEEVDAVIRRNCHSNSRMCSSMSHRSSSSSRCSIDTYSRKEKNASQWWSLPPPALAPSLSVRVCGRPDALFQASDTLFLTGHFDCSSCLLVDLSWLPRDVAGMAREAVVCAASPFQSLHSNCRRSTCCYGTNSSSDTGCCCEKNRSVCNCCGGGERVQPLLQFVGEVRAVAVADLPADEQRLLAFRLALQKGPCILPSLGSDSNSPREDEVVFCETARPFGLGSTAQLRQQQKLQKQPPCLEEVHDTTVLLDRAAERKVVRERVGLLRARVCRRVDGMDMDLYVESLSLFRQLQQQMPHAGGENTSVAAGGEARESSIRESRLRDYESSATGA